MPVNQTIDKRNKDIKIYINGSFFNRDDAKISVFDSGFLLGDGIWEGIRLVDNNWVFLDEHLDRLYEGCKAIDIDICLSKDDIKKAILETQKINRLTKYAGIDTAPSYSPDGDFITFEPNTSHSSYTENGCLILTFMRGQNNKLKK